MGVGLPQRHTQGCSEDGPGVPISVVLPVLNEEENLAEALRSVDWAGEIFVVDSGSHDSTPSIAAGHGARVVQFEYESLGPKKKTWALQNLDFTYDWALFLDADERVTPALRTEIEAVLSDNPCDGYYLDREMIFRGRALSSYRPDWNLRLFRHRLASMEDFGVHALPGTGDNEIHEHFLVKGEKGFLREPLVHRDYRGIGPWLERHNKYATWEAHLYRRWRGEPLAFSAAALRDPVARNRLARRLWVRLPGRPVWRFAIWLFVKRGFRDGTNGLVYAFLMGWYEVVIGLKLEEIEDELP
jgi:glycosyltransferase involved in cell wall biosynthesis